MTIRDLINISRKRKIAVIFAVSILVIIAILILIFLISQDQNFSRLLGKQSDKPTNAEEIIEAVGKFVELPKETPTVSSIADVSKLKDQPFFAKAQNGDKVLVFAQAQRAIIYRPSINKIIEISTINTGPNTSPEPTSIQDSLTPTINLRSILTSSPTNTATPLPSSEPE